MRSIRKVPGSQRGPIHWTMSAAIVSACVLPILAAVLVASLIAGSFEPPASAWSERSWLFHIAGLAIFVGISASILVARHVDRLCKEMTIAAVGTGPKRSSAPGEKACDPPGPTHDDDSIDRRGDHQARAERRRQEHYAELEVAAASFAHEVRNPLGIIKTTADLIGRKPDLTEADKRRLGYIADEVRRIDRLVRDFLVFARPVQRLRMVTIGELLERALGICRDEIELRGIRLEIEDRSQNACLMVDLDQMVQALLNLVLNAMEAMGEPGGLLTITIFPPDEGCLSLTLRDTGPGIAPELLDRIFDPFVTTKANGSGLGLATVSTILKSHGGGIEAGNAEHGGAVFKLTIPVSPPFPKRDSA